MGYSVYIHDRLNETKDKTYTWIMNQVIAQNLTGCAHT